MTQHRIRHGEASAPSRSPDSALADPDGAVSGSPDSAQAVPDGAVTGSPDSAQAVPDGAVTRCAVIRPPGMRHGATLGQDHGSAPAWVLAWCGTGMALIAGLALLGAGSNAGARAATAADLGALAGADALAAAPLTGSAADPCTVARDYTARNGATMTECTVEGEDVTVTAAVTVAPLPAISRTARAGPPPDG